MKKVFFGIVVYGIGMSCTPRPEEIKYGKDLCHFCTMTIVDNKYAAQYVTNKGRAYKFDAIECLVQEIEDRQENELAIILVSDYNNPGKLIDARSANFIISKAISSPMGANLMAIKDTNSLSNTMVGKDAQQYNWPDICIKLQD